MMQVIREEIEHYVKEEWGSDFNKWTKKDQRELLDKTVDEYARRYLIYLPPANKDIGWIAGKTLTDGYAGFFTGKVVVLVEDGDDAEDLILKYTHAV